MWLVLLLTRYNRSSSLLQKAVRKHGVAANPLYLHTCTLLADRETEGRPLPAGRLTSPGSQAAVRVAGSGLVFSSQNRCLSCQKHAQKTLHLLLHTFSMSL